MCYHIFTLNNNCLHTLLPAIYPPAEPKDFVKVPINISTSFGLQLK